MTLLRVGVLTLVSLVAFYFVLIVCLTFPTPQKALIYLHWLHLPGIPKFHIPEHYGFAHNAVRNLKINTKDNLSLGAWHILPTDYHTKEGLRYKTQVDGDVFDLALMDPDYDTVIYFHGNALSRASSMRIDLYKSLMNRYPKLNIFTIDYRGFGDSDGTPSEDGLALDARAAYDWLISKKVSPERISIIGHSLGTGVSTTLAHDLSKAGTPPKALILKAAFTSLPRLVLEYRLFEIFHILGPLNHLPIGKEWVISHLRTKFDSLSRIAEVDCPILITVGNKDFEIPASQSTLLFYGALGGNTVQYDKQWLANGPSNIQVNQVQNEATVYTGSKSTTKTKSALVKLVCLEHANHNNLGYYDYFYESVHDITSWPTASTTATL